LSQDLRGPWHPIAAVLAGRPLDIAEMRVAHFEFDDLRYTIFDRAGTAVDQGYYELNQTVCPWSIDLNGDLGAAAGKKLQAICKLEDDGMGHDILHLSYALDGSHRPTSFVEAETLHSESDTERWVIAMQFKRLLAS
jgi:uncharacterized protein (TIGR03067 family)